jgi:hypothetical protein
MKEFILAALVTITTPSDAAAPPMEKPTYLLEFQFENGPKCRMTLTEGTQHLRCTDIPTTVQQEQK